MKIYDEEIDEMRIFPLAVEVQPEKVYEPHDEDKDVVEPKYKFQPAYNKYGTWYYHASPMSMRFCNWWFAREGIDRRQTQTVVIPNNCEWCPLWTKKLYMHWKLYSVFLPKAKEF